MSREDPDEMTITEVAALLKCHYNTVRRLIKRGDLPAWTIEVKWQARYDTAPNSQRTEWRLSRKAVLAWTRLKTHVETQRRLRKL